jgi:HEAT repeat protein
MGYAAPRRASDELYDTAADPHQLKNLAREPEHRAVLERLRREFRRWQLATRDAGFLTEPQMWSRLETGKTPWEIAHDEQLYPLGRLLDAAAAVGDPEAHDKQRAWLRDPDNGLRYWAAVGLAAQEQLSPADLEALRGALQDSSAVVRIESAAALARHGETSSALPVLARALQDMSSEVVLHAVRALELLGPLAQPARPEMQAALARAREREARNDAIAMFIRFSLEAALANQDGQP